MMTVQGQHSAPTSGASRGGELVDRGEVILALNDVHFSYEAPSVGHVAVFEGLHLAVAPGEVVCVLGPSGCGKTTLLNLVAGLTKPGAGDVSVNGRRVSPRERQCATVFQSPNLLPWRSVLRNVTYGLEIAGELNRQDRDERGRQLLDLVDLSAYADAYPWQLSGGMQQRVNLARALAVQPALVLLDEPFAALDAQTRATLQDEFSRLLAEMKATAVFVTHDVDEAVYLADRVLVLSRRPAHVVCELTVDLERPRHEQLRSTTSFTTLTARIRDALRVGAEAAPRHDREVTQ